MDGSERESGLERVGLSVQAHPEPREMPHPSSMLASEQSSEEYSLVWFPFFTTTRPSISDKTASADAEQRAIQRDFCACGYGETTVLVWSSMIFQPSGNFRQTR